LKTPKTGLLTCAFFSYLPRDELAVRYQWLIVAFRDGRKSPAELLPSSEHFDTTGEETSALTVAGQLRNFTAFPSILGDSFCELNYTDVEQS